jgi:2-iminobutanoate/2-iminopropanoate deaminase
MTEIRTTSTPRAPVAIGPYSQAVISDGWIFASGQIALDPDTGTLDGRDVATQTDRVLRNLKAVVESAGGRMNTVVKTTVYLLDMADFKAMNDVYAAHFGNHRPARATVAVAGLPAGAGVEIDAIARIVIPQDLGGSKTA